MTRTRFDSLVYLFVLQTMVTMVLVLVMVLMLYLYDKSGHNRKKPQETTKEITKSIDIFHC